MKIKKIIIRFLDTLQEPEITSQIIQKDIPKFAKDIYNIDLIPDTVSQVWYHLRSDEKFLRENGYEVEEQMDGRKKKFIIRRTNEIYRSSSGQDQQPGEDNLTV